MDLMGSNFSTVCFFINLWLQEDLNPESIKASEISEATNLPPQNLPQIFTVFVSGTQTDTEHLMLSQKVANCAMISSKLIIQREIKLKN